MGKRRTGEEDTRKRELIGELIKSYNVKSIKDMEEAFKDLFGNTLRELEEHLY